jgi:magnesium transporter
MVWHVRLARRTADGTAPAVSPGGPAPSATVDCAAYVDGARLPGRYDHAGALAAVREPVATESAAFAWIGLYEPDARQIDGAVREFEVHPVVAERLASVRSRTGLHRFDAAVVLVLKTLDYVHHRAPAGADDVVAFGQIVAIVGPDFVLTVRRGRHGALADVRRRLDSSPDALRLGRYAVLHAIADHVVGTYASVAERIDDDVAALEADVFSAAGVVDIELAYLLKREISEMRRAVAPLTVSLQRLISDCDDLVCLEVRRYLRDVLDRTHQVVERIGAYDDVLDSLLDTAVARINNQQNIDMRKIAAWVSFASVPTLIAGIYGMNFDEMPELHWALGYPMVLCAMVTTCVLLYRNFRRNRWL